MSVKAIVGTKVGMMQMTTDDGQVIPVTIVHAPKCFVSQVKTTENDGYEAVQLAAKESKRVNKANSGHTKDLKKAFKSFKEFRTSVENVNKGDEITVETFEVGDIVKFSGISKGKGFAGTVKRHNFNTGPKSHGSMNVRRPGSIGSMYPQKIFKGKKMSGQMGAEQVSGKSSVVLVDAEKEVVGIKGAIPGPRKGQVSIVGV